MRGTLAKRLRKAGLKSGPAPKPERPMVTHTATGWRRTSRRVLKPSPIVEAAAVAKRARRAERNLRVES